MKVKKQNRMGTFYVRCRVENHVDRSKAVTVAKLLVDTGSDYTWIPSHLLEKIGVEREKLPFIMVNSLHQPTPFCLAPVCNLSHPIPSH